MLDGGISIITLIAGFGYAIVVGTSVLFMPVRKIAQLDKALMVAAWSFIQVQRHVPLDMRVSICDTHLIRGGGTGRIYMRLKQEVEFHCDYVERFSARISAEIMLAEAKEGAAKEAAEQAAALEEQTNEEPLDILEEKLRDIYKHDGRWTRVKGHLPRTQRSSPTPANLASADLLNGSAVSLPIPYPVMRPQPSTPHCPPSELEGIVLEGNLIDLSDTPPDLSQREGILVDLSTDDAESLHRLLSADNESSRLEGVDLLNTLLKSSSAVNTPVQTMRPSKTPVSTHTSTPANANVDPIPGPSAPRKRRRFDRLVDGLQVASSSLVTSQHVKLVARKASRASKDDLLAPEQCLLNISATFEVTATTAHA
ncbi:hypothetical protein ARMGADRAFT_1027004 [Armillaria gallica]|uniref:Uncharacterized protein n=1 Tax=Armillaria gallica TaxID=47427 RepID=A0A2H3DUF1_ARMGA|nr:hypothetical protein ARMGADRAFT_1027004 [Armillaria gallica]